MKLHNILSINGIEIDEYLNKYYKNISTDKEYEYNITGSYSSNNYTFSSNVINGNFDFIDNRITYSNLSLSLNDMVSNRFLISPKPTSLLVSTSNNVFNLSVNAHNFNNQVILNDFTNVIKNTEDSNITLLLNNRFKLNCDNFVKNIIRNIYSADINALNLNNNTIFGINGNINCVDCLNNFIFDYACESLFSNKLYNTYLNINCINNFSNNTINSVINLNINCEKIVNKISTYITTTDLEIIENTILSNIITYSNQSLITTILSINRDFIISNSTETSRTLYSYVVPVSISNSYFTFNDTDLLSFNIDENNSEIVNITLYEYSSLIHNVSYNNSSSFKFSESNFTISFGKEIGQQSLIYGARNRMTTITETLMPITLTNHRTIYYDTSIISGILDYNAFSISINETSEYYDSLMLNLKYSQNSFIYSFYDIYAGYNIFTVITLTEEYETETLTLTSIYCNVSSLILDYNISYINNLSINANNIYNQAYNNINNLDLKCKMLFNDFSNNIIYTYTNNLNVSFDKTLYSGVITYRKTYSSMNSTSEEFLTKVINTIYTNTSELTNYRYIFALTTLTTKFEVDTINNSIINELIELTETKIPATIRCSCTGTTNTSCNITLSIHDKYTDTKHSILEQITNINKDAAGGIAWKRESYTYSFSNQMNRYGVVYFTLNSIHTSITQITNQMLNKYVYNIDSINNLNITAETIYNQMFNNISNLNINCKDFGIMDVNAKVDYYGNIIDNCNIINLMFDNCYLNNYNNNNKIIMNGNYMYSNFINSVDILKMNVNKIFFNNYYFIDKCKINADELNDNIFCYISSLNLKIDINELNKNTFENIDNLCISQSELKLSNENIFKNIDILNLNIKTIHSLNLENIEHMNIYCNDLGVITPIGPSDLEIFNLNSKNKNLNIECNNNFNVNVISNVDNLKLNINEFYNSTILNSLNLLNVQNWISEEKYTNTETIFSYNDETRNIHIIQNCTNVNINASNIHDLLIVRNCINCSFTNIHNSMSFEKSGRYTKFATVIFYNISNLIIKKGETNSENIYIVKNIGDGKFNKDLLI